MVTHRLALFKKAPAGVGVLISIAPGATFEVGQMELDYQAGYSKRLGFPKRLGRRAFLIPSYVRPFDK
jgi:hypothetical protein